MLENALGNFLMTAARTQPLVDVRVYPLRGKQGDKLDQIVYARITSQRDHTNDGPTGFVSAIFQFDCLSKTFKAAKALAAAVRLDLDGFSGSMGASPDVAEVDGVFLDDERDTWNDEFEMYSVQLDFTIQYQEDAGR